MANLQAHYPHMRHAIALARKQLGRCAPNPAVGCVIVAPSGQIIGVGATHQSGRPHAEAMAIAMAGADARGATAYVTLEPCSHHGQTPPCAQALIDAGIARVFIASQDPNPKVSGSGIAMLRAAGMEVVLGIAEDEAALLHEGFFKSLSVKRPLVSLKIASSLDGKIATASGESQWITSEQARRYGHALRGEHDAIATGIGTVLADDPALTCRLAGREEDSPKRFVFDRNTRLPTNAKLHPCVALSQPLAEALEVMALEHGITRLLVEAGPRLSSAFLQAGLVDWLYWFKAPLLLGAAGRSALGDLADAPLNRMPRMRLERRLQLGADSCECYRISPLPDYS